MKITVNFSTVWLFDCLHLLSPLYEADKCFHRTKVYYKMTVMDIDLKTRQLFKYATLPCDFTPRKTTAFEPDNNESFVLTPKTVLRVTPMLFQPQK